MSSNTFVLAQPTVLPGRHGVGRTRSAAVAAMSSMTMSSWLEAGSTRLAWYCVIASHRQSASTATSRWMSSMSSSLPPAQPADSSCHMSTKDRTHSRVRAQDGRLDKSKIVLAKRY